MLAEAGLDDKARGALWDAEGPQPDFGIMIPQPFIESGREAEASLFSILYV